MAQTEFERGFIAGFIRAIIILCFPEAQTEFERGFIAGVSAMKEKAAIRILDLNIEIPKEEKAKP